MGVGFENTCSASGKWNISRVVQKLCGWVDETIRVRLISTESILKAITVVSQKDDARLVPRRVQLSFLLLWSLCSEPVWGIKFYFVCWGTFVVSEWYVVFTPGPAVVASFSSWFYLKKWGSGVGPRFLFFSSVNQENEEAQWV